MQGLKIQSPGSLHGTYEYEMPMAGLEQKESERQEENNNVRSFLKAHKQKVRKRGRQAISKAIFFIQWTLL